MLKKLVVLTVCGFIAGGCATLLPAANVPVLSHDFRTNPSEEGWELLQFRWVRQPISGEWVSDAGASDAFALKVESGYWQSPIFASTPHQYYRLTFQSKADGVAYWAAQFFNEAGEPLIADHYTGIDPSENWIDNEFYFQGKAEAVNSRLWFQPLGNKMLRVRNVKLSEASEAQVLEWADRLYAQIPPVEYQAPADRWTLIPRTMQKLRNGERLRIVMLGDSIANDTGNSPVDKLIQRLYPNSTIEVITSVRGGTGCQWYQEENRVDEFVVRYEPDLVMIIAISHGYDLEAIRNVIRQIRERCDAEILLTSAGVSQESREVEFLVRQRGMDEEAAKAKRTAFYDSVVKMAEEEQVELLHSRVAWNEYMEKATQQHDVMWFMRDHTHANARGRQIMARIIERYFAPK